MLKGMLTKNLNHRFEFTDIETGVCVELCTGQMFEMYDQIKEIWFMVRMEFDSFRGCYYAVAKHASIYDLEEQLVRIEG